MRREYLEPGVEVRDLEDSANERSRGNQDYAAVRQTRARHESDHCGETGRVEHSQLGEFDGENGSVTVNELLEALGEGFGVLGG